MKLKFKILLLTLSCFLCSNVVFTSVFAAGDNKIFLLNLKASSGLYSDIERLVAGGADVDARDSKGKAPLHCAAEKGKYMTVKTLVGKCHADVLARDNRGMTPLHYAAKKGSSVVVKFLLLNGPKEMVNAVDKLGKTPLHYAAATSSCSTVDALISIGNARMDIRDYEDHLPIDCAKGKNIANMRQYMLLQSFHEYCYSFAITDTLKRRCALSMYTPNIMTIRTMLSDEQGSNTVNTAAQGSCSADDCDVQFERYCSLMNDKFEACLAQYNSDNK